MNKVIKFDEEEPLNDVDNEKKLEKVKPECDSEEAAENVTKKEKKKKSKNKQVLKQDRLNPLNASPMCHMNFKA